MDRDKLNRYRQAQTLRSDATHARYIAFLERRLADPKTEACLFCQKQLLLKAFKHWIIVDNLFPYDRLYTTSHMLAPIRHVATESELTDEELKELIWIKQRRLDEYRLIIENIGDRVSVKGHLHFHILS